MGAQPTPQQGGVGAEVRRRGALGVDVWNGRAEGHEHLRGICERPWPRRPVRGAECESTQESGVGRSMRNPGGREARIGCAALQLFEVVVAHRCAHGHPAAQREPLVDVVAE